MDALVAGWAVVTTVARLGLLGLAAVTALVAGVDWAVRTRRINPFGGTARFFRARVDPLLLPVERVIVRAGGRPSTAPWWAVAAVIVGGLGLLWVLDLVGALLIEASYGLRSPRQLPLLLVTWAFRFVEFALLVRVVSSWFRVSPYASWSRWAYASTEWLLAPLRRIIPPIGGMLDVSPLVAYLLLSWILAPAVTGLIKIALGA